MVYGDWHIIHHFIVVLGWAVKGVLLPGSKNSEPNKHTTRGRTDRIYLSLMGWMAQKFNKPEAWPHMVYNQIQNVYILHVIGLFERFSYN